MGVLLEGQIYVGQIWVMQILAEQSLRIRIKMWVNRNVMKLLPCLPMKNGILAGLWKNLSSNNMQNDPHFLQLIQLRSQIEQVDKLLSGSHQYNDPIIWRQKIASLSTSSELKVTNLDLPSEMGGCGFTNTEMA